jgi:mycothiol synthase
VSHLPVDAPVEEVLALAAAASRTDAATALSEDAVLRLRSGEGTHLTRSEAGTLVGYAQLSPSGDGFEGELLVHPDHRRRGHGSALLAQVSATATGPVRLWSHGDTPGARALAHRTGWSRVRELLRLERPAAGLLDLEVPDLPSGVSVRPFVPGADDEAWVAVNAAAFAGHPEQGRWTVADLRARIAEPWFDAGLLLLAERSGELVAFCWLKVEDGQGELYVLGVAPGHAGAGLGRALLVRGLRAVAADAGAPELVDLYVDGDNVPAVKLYTRLGFERAAVDVQYLSPAR